jgi:hypothetical protein
VDLAQKLGLEVAHLTAGYPRPADWSPRASRPTRPAGSG